MMADQSRILNLSARMYSWLLLAYPPRFRRAFGWEMAQVFRDDLRHTLQESGPAGLVGLWILVVFDLFKTAMAEHIWEVFHMPLEKLDRWSGLAAALGGALFVYSIVFEQNTSDFYRFLLILLPLALFWAIALTGLYRRLPVDSQPGNKVTLGLALMSLLLIVIGVSLLTPEADYAWIMLMIGFYGLVLAIAGMGIITIVRRVLGIWRFVPLALAGVFLGFILSGSEADILDNPVQLAFIILTGLGWLLLGIGLWMQPEDVSGTALTA